VIAGIVGLGEMLDHLRKLLDNVCCWPLQVRLVKGSPSSRTAERSDIVGEYHDDEDDLHVAPIDRDLPQVAVAVDLWIAPYTVVFKK
jgi:hypothetical protein